MNRITTIIKTILMQFFQIEVNETFLRQLLWHGDKFTHQSYTPSEVSDLIGKL